MRRRNVLASLAAAVAGGCSKVADSPAGTSLFEAAERWHKQAQRLLAGRDALVPEFEPAQISPFFRGNGSVSVDTPD